MRANADAPEDPAKAREFGAEGIGLCRTEHMFMAEGRLPVVREMIMASSEDERRDALERLLPYQQGDFEGIFEAMAGLPVTIRLLDPPLHEFLPSLDEATSDDMRDRIVQLHEANPMLGTRGCRLGLLFPEIYAMQVQAIVRAALAVEERTGDAPLVEIMHPLVGFAEELRRLRELTLDTASAELEHAGHQIEYLVGTMIELPRACLRADEIRRLRVRANADTPEDAAKAREFGAEGIGLCRTEHMFMAEGRLPLVLIDEDHLAHVDDALALEEHVLGPAEADPLGAELPRPGRVLRVVGIRAHLQPADPIRPLEDR